MTQDGFVTITSMKPTLYIFIGAPGAGKTTLAQAISAQTGATHLWADRERHKLFKEPTHSQTESDELYEQLNNATEYLLQQGKSVVYDTNFNFYADRLKMREIALRHKAAFMTIWVDTPLAVAKQRAVGEHEVRNGYSVSMTSQQFDSIVSKLEPPKDDEQVIKIDGSELDTQAALRLLGIA